MHLFLQNVVGLLDVHSCCVTTSLPQGFEMNITAGTAHADPYAGDTRHKLGISTQSDRLAWRLFMLCNDLLAARV